jgi:hypothetical protein
MIVESARKRVESARERAEVAILDATRGTIAVADRCRTNGSGH